METKEIKKEVLDMVIAASVLKTIGSCKNVTPEEAQAEPVGESLETRINDFTHAFEAYNLFTVILAKYEGREVTVKHLTKMAKRFVRICLKGVDGVELDDILTEVKVDKNGRGHLTLSFRKIVKEK